MATRAHSIPQTRATGWAGLVSRTGIERIWTEALPEQLAQSVLGPFTLVARLTLGWIFVWSGFDKLIRGFTASPFLLHATQGPLTFWFHSLGGSQMATNIINPLVVWGEILIGLTLIFGIFTRAGAFWGTIMMMLYYLAQFPPAQNPWMDEHLVYILLLGLLSALGAGRILGLDAWIERLPWVKRHHLVTLLLG